ncbi:hypothetical protein ACWDZ4_04525 [Streptomyces sp. NPDC003016]
MPWENAENGYVVASGSDGARISTTGRGIGPTAVGLSTAGSPVPGLTRSG